MGLCFSCETYDDYHHHGHYDYYGHHDGHHYGHHYGHHHGRKCCKHGHFGYCHRCTDKYRYNNPPPYIYQESYTPYVQPVYQRYQTNSYNPELK